MRKRDPNLEIRFARTADEIRAAQNLRYRVFVEELGGKTALTDHQNRLEVDEYDHEVEHLCLFDKRLESVDPLTSVVGVYRLIRQNVAEKLGGFYSQCEYDLSKVLTLPGEKLELGRSCIDPAYRGGAAMAMLWSALGEYVNRENITYLFGTASFQNIEIGPKIEALSNLFQNHLMDAEICAEVLEDKAVEAKWLEKDDINRLSAMRNTPSLIKAYLRLGGTIGRGAFLDLDFNTIDVFVFMKTEEMVQKYRAMYQ